MVIEFKSQGYLAKHECSANWGDYKSNQMLDFEERRKPEYPWKNLSEQSRDLTNSTHLWGRIRKSIPGGMTIPGDLGGEGYHS